MEEGWLVGGLARRGKGRGLPCLDRDHKCRCHDL